MLKKYFSSFKTRSFLYMFVFFFLVGLVIHLPSFFYGLTADHLNVLYEWRNYFLVPTINSFRSFISPYGASAVIARTTDWFFGLDPFAYFFFPYLTKAFCAVTVYKLSLYVLKKSNFALITAVASMFLFAGIQATTPGATVFLSVGFMNLGTLRLLKIYETKDIRIFRESIKAYLLFLLAFVLTPIRMYALIPYLLTAEIFALLMKKTKLKAVLFRLIIFYLGYTYFKNVGLVESRGTASGAATTLSSLSYYQQIPNLLGVLVFSIGAYRQVLIPDIVVDWIGKIYHLLGLSLPMFYLVAILPGFLIYLYLQKFKGKLLPSYWPYVSFILHGLLVLLIYRNLSEISLLFQISVYLGGVIAYLLLTILVSLLYQKHRLAIPAAIFFQIPLTFMIVPFILYRLDPHETLSRYFAVSTYGAAFILGLILALSKKTVRKATIGIVSVLIIFNGYLVYRYYSDAGMNGLYNWYIMDVFNFMNSELGDRSKNGRPLVFLRSDNPTFLSTVLNQGHLRFSLVNNNLSEIAQPWFITNFEELKNIYHGNQFPFITDINDVYGFEIKNKKTYTITDEVRASLNTSKD